VDDNGVKLGPARFGEPAHGFFVGQAFAIGAGRNHGVERIDYADDSGHYGYFLVLEPRGISLAIEGLVVMENIKSRAFEAGEHAQYGPAVFRMLFHQFVFFRIKTRRLSENGIWNSHFADVVQKSNNFEVLQFGFFQT